MTWGVVPFVFAAGMGLGLYLGIVFARQDQGKMFGLISQTTENLMTSALFPGLKGVVEQSETPEMFETIDADPEHIPEFLREPEEPWDYTSAGVGAETPS